MSWFALEWSIVGPAIVAGLLVLSLHVPLGQVVLQRGPGATPEQNCRRIDSPSAKYTEISPGVPVESASTAGGRLRPQPMYRWNQLTPPLSDSYSANRDTDSGPQVIGPSHFMMKTTF